MRFIRTFGSVVWMAALVPSMTLAASREQQEMQRDIAQLQDQVRTLQSGFDQKMASLETLVQQALDAGNKANTSVSVLGANVAQTIDRDLRDHMAPVAGLSAKVDNVNNDVSEIRNAIADLTASVNRLSQQLTDINNQIKVLQAPPAPPPPADAPGGQIPGAPPAAAVPPVSGEALFSSANNDYSSGKLDLAINEFREFLKRFPDDPNAAGAQFNIGQSRMTQQKYDLAAKDFDMVIENYPDSGSILRDAWFYKGMALKEASHRDDAIKTWRDLIRKFPTSKEAKDAREQLRALGVSATTAAAPAARHP